MKKTTPPNLSPSMPTLLILAGGTGGHIFPALAVAQELHAQGWRIVWVGARAGLEATLVPPYGFTMQYIDFSGLRGKGWLAKLQLPGRLLRACWQSLCVLKRVRPDVVLGMGGYISFPAGLMTVLTRRALILHEQNSIPGLANKILASIARRRLVAFPNALPHAQWTGNPLRAAFLNIAPPKERYAERTGPLRILVAGGSLGATALNEVVPAALALLPSAQRPWVVHQAGQKHIDALQAHYQQAGLLGDQVDLDSTQYPLDVLLSGSGPAPDQHVLDRPQAVASGTHTESIEPKPALTFFNTSTPTLVSFIDDISQAYAQADLVICRAGAMTVAEIAAVGVAALFVPFPHAVDDHQTHNAAFLVERKAAQVIQQAQLSATTLAAWLSTQTRTQLAAMAEQARAGAMPNAAQQIAQICIDECQR